MMASWEGMYVCQMVMRRKPEQRPWGQRAGGRLAGVWSGQEETQAEALLRV